MKNYLTDKLNFNYRNSALLVLPIVAIILFIRKTDALINPQFWAEDGIIFFLQQYEYGASALFYPYAGYLHLVPRLTAFAAELFFPYSAIPAVYNYSSLLITFIVALKIFSPRFNVNHKPLMALTIVLVPHYANEIFLTLTNTQWILSIMPIVVLFKEKPASKYGNIGIQYACDLATLIICGLTGPFIILLAPFYGWKWIREKNLYTSVILMAVVATSLIQLSFVTSAAGHSQDINLNLEVWSTLIGNRLMGNLFLGDNVAYRINHYILSSLYLGGVVLLLLIARHKKDRFMFFSIGIHLIFLLAAFYRFKSNPGDLIPPGNAPRYFYVPYIMLAWCLISLLTKHSKWKNMLIATALILILGSSSTSGFHSKPFIDYNWSFYSSSIGKEDVTIPINPKGWQMPIKAHSK